MNGTLNFGHLVLSSLASTALALNMLVGLWPRKKSRPWARQ